MVKKNKLDLNYKTKWDLSNIYSSLEDEKFNEDINKIKPMSKKIISKYKGKIKNFKAKDFIEFFDYNNKITLKIKKTLYYLHYLSELDTQNQDIIRKQGEIEHLMTQINNELLFISQEFKEIGYDKLIEFSKDELLKDYKNYFYQKAQNIKYLLDEKQEFVLNLKENSGADAFCNLYEELTNSFMFEIEIDGEKKLLTDSHIRALRLDKEEEVRKKATKSMREIYNNKKIQITLGNTYNSIVKDWVSEVKIRGYKNPLSIRNIGEELDDEVVDLLLNEVENAYPIFHKYLKIKTKLLGKKKMSSWNMLAPINLSRKNSKNKKIKEKEYSFEESLKLYLETIKDFDEEFYIYSCDMFEKARVDVFPKEGKRGGAFAFFSSGMPSFVLLNHTNKLKDIPTLAHEMGHAIHGHLRQHQKAEVYSPGLSLEETASIFNEMILSEAITKKMSSDEKLYFLDQKLEDIFATIFRQVQYVLFEKKVHEKILSGKELTYEDFNKMWRSEQIKLTGDIEFDVPAQEESGWSTIPHIFRSPFYCYAYAFGNLLTFSLYEQYKKEGKPFVEKYKNILRAGGSKLPYDLLKENGLDIKSKEFYRNGLKIIETMVEDFEKLSYEYL